MKYQKCIFLKIKTALLILTLKDVPLTERARNFFKKRFPANKAFLNIFKIRTLRKILSWVTQRSRKKLFPPSLLATVKPPPRGVYFIIK